MKEIAGQLNGTNLTIGIVISRFNELIGKNLLEGALDALKRHGVDNQNITVVWVPGALEIPLAAQAMVANEEYDAIICLGVIIKGATPHFDYVAGQSASGITQLALQYQLPILNAILTTNTIEEAIERAGTKCGNKGYDVAVGAIEMANLIQNLGKKQELEHPKKRQHKT